MTTKTLSFLLIVLLIGTSSKVDRQDHETLVRSYLEARNAFDIDKVSQLITDDYHETFIDDNAEITGKEQLLDMILYGKEMDSHMKLLKIRSEGNTVVTTEKNSNYMDIALKRKPRTFKITYHFWDNKIAKQVIDTVPGYYKIARQNLKRYNAFKAYCNENDLEYRLSGFDKHNGALLRKALEIYKADKKK